MLLSARTESNQRCAKGLLPVSTLPEAVLTVIAPWTPVTGDALLIIG